MPTKNSDLSQVQASKVRAKPGQYVKDLYNQEIVDRIFEDGSIPVSKLAGSVGGLFDGMTITNGGEESGQLTLGFQLTSGGVALTEKGSFLVTIYPVSGAHQVSLVNILNVEYGDKISDRTIFSITDINGYVEIVVQTSLEEDVPITIVVVLPNGATITDSTFVIPAASGGPE